MLELIAIITIIILFMLFLKWKGKTGTLPSKKEMVSEKLNQEGIVGKSTFVLTTTKRAITEPDLSGKMDIEVSLEYEPDIETIEEQEELEQFGLPSEISSDITFEDMMEVVNDVESVQPQNPAKSGKLLYENESTDWVEQITSSSSDYQKRIVELIDLHLGKLDTSENKQMLDDGLAGFNIRDYST
ncbi:hypothetical protein [Maribellus maritimus]|uniref:hypothetical protein n=1 Tax=Maribellus maritimus TaxID=2870838 RepID=UPI001EECA68B|nr:hypothetical protein [Maribellus maritimus]MCG6191368.1 hypothetical protein [Maribellus maritimus]